MHLVALIRIKLLKLSLSSEKLSLSYLNLVFLFFVVQACHRGDCDVRNTIVQCETLSIAGA
jgi:hypothetical protein